MQYDSFHTGSLGLLVKNTKKVYVETAVFRKAAQVLNEHGHVTISGASGEGKTATALMIGEKYRQKGYRVLFVNDIDRFQLKRDTHEK